MEMLKGKIITGTFFIKQEGITEEEVYDRLKELFIVSQYDIFKFEVSGIKRRLKYSNKIQR